MEKICDGFYPVDQEELLSRWRELNGIYICPKDEQGNRLGPLVGYAGTYKDERGKDLAYVGDVYANFARVETDPFTCPLWARFLATSVRHRGYRPTLCIGAPMGGIVLATHLSNWLEVRIAFAEKKVMAVAAGADREKSKLVIARHDVWPSDNVIIVEDVCNNFSTTDEMIELVHDHGATVVGIACALNRSSRKSYWVSNYGADIPIISLIHMELPEYQQDDPAVAVDMLRGNYVAKPKQSWSDLVKAMNQAA